MQQVQQLDESKASDVYGIPVKLVKLVQYVISEPLSMIFDQCFVIGIFQEKLKLACVTPILKANSKLALTNYRPISLLPVVSKLLEQLIYKRLSNFLDKSKIVYYHQFGFQNKKSTSTAILDIYSKLIDSIEQKKSHVQNSWILQKLLIQLIQVITWLGMQLRINCTSKI